MLSALAVLIEVKIRAEARFTVLKAFMRRGSGFVRLALDILRKGERTRITNHAILRANRSNNIFAIISPLTPRIIILLGDFRKLRIQLCAFFMVLLQALAALCSECIFVQRIDVNGCTDLVYSAEICGFVSG